MIDISIRKEGDRYVGVVTYEGGETPQLYDSDLNDLMDRIKTFINKLI